MKNDVGSLKTYHFYLVTAFFLVGLVILSVFSSARLWGILIIAATLVYFAGIVFLRVGRGERNRFKSNAREEILKHQHKK